MSQSTLAILVTMMFSAIGVVGDTFLKLAGERAAGAMADALVRDRLRLYASTAFGWVFVMQHLKLATIGVFTASRWSCC